jgi:Helix-turn-helix domain
MLFASVGFKRLRYLALGVGMRLPTTKVRQTCAMNRIEVSTFALAPASPFWATTRTPEAPMPSSCEIGLPEAAHRLKIPYQDCHRLVLTGVLRGRKKGNRWLVEAEDLERLAEDRAPAPQACERRSIA